MEVSRREKKVVELNAIRSEFRWKRKVVGLCPSGSKLLVGGENLVRAYRLR